MSRSLGPVTFSAGRTWRTAHQRPTPPSRLGPNGVAQPGAPFGFIDLEIIIMIELIWVVVKHKFKGIDSENCPLTFERGSTNQGLQQKDLRAFHGFRDAFGRFPDVPSPAAKARHAKGLAAHPSADPGMRPWHNTPHK